MASKLTLIDISSGFKGTDIQTNFTSIEDEFDDTLSRSGKSPNQMEVNIDMNSEKIVNLGVPTQNQDAARLKDILDNAENLDSATASVVTIDDTGGNFSSDNVEGALEEIDNVKTVDSVSDLQSGSFESGIERLWLSGYYGVGTAGGGPLYRDADDTTTTDNGGTVFVDADGVRWKREKHTPSITMEQAGAVGDGSTDDESAIQNLVDLINDDTSGVPIYVEGRPGAVYVMGNDKIITRSNVFFNFHGARFTGSSNARFEVNGDPGVDGGEPQVSNVHIWNMQVGSDSLGSSDVSRAPKFMWAANCTMGNITKRGPSGTAFNFNFCRSCHSYNTNNYEGKDGSSGAISFLVLHCLSCTINEHFHDGNGTPEVYGVQVKGGYGNSVNNGRIVRVKAGQMSPDHAFRDRGDAPYGSSNTGGTYPYSSGGWDNPDDKRACHNTIFFNCTVDDSEFSNNFFTQEAVDTVFDKCFDGEDDGVSVSYRAVKTTGGKERGFVFRDCHSNAPANRSFMVEGQSGDQLEGVRLINPVSLDSSGEGIRLENTKGAYIESPYIDNAGNDAIRGIGDSGTIITGSGLARNCNGRPYNGTAGADIPVARISGYRGEGCSQTNQLDVFLDMDQTSEIQEGQTTDDSLDDTIARATLPDGKTVTGLIEVTGVSSGGTVAVFREQIIVRASGGSLTINEAEVMPPINPGGWTGVSYSDSGNELQIRVGGAAGTTINWKIMTKFALVDG